jgi:hypothetical protein
MKLDNKENIDSLENKTSLYIINVTEINVARLTVIKTQNSV